MVSDLSHTLTLCLSPDTAKTCYMFTSESTGGDWYNPQLTEDMETEMQYLVKWVGWSHLHNTWESGEIYRNL